MIELNGIQISDNNINTKKNVKIYVDEKQLNNKVGELSDLETTNKSSIVNAINEVKNTTDTLQIDVNRIYSDFTIIPNTPTEQEFTYKKSDEGVIEKGVAVIDKVKGNSVVWNQRVKNATFINTSEWDATYSTFSVSGGIASVTASKDGDNYTQQLIPMVVGHKYIYIFMAATDTANKNRECAYIFYCGPINNKAIKAKDDTNWHTYNAIVTCVSNTHNIVRLEVTKVGTSQFKNISLIDLTQMFGAGNEPSTYEEFLSRKPKVADEYAYNEGTIVNNKVEGVKTTGRNLFDISKISKDYRLDHGVPAVNNGRYISDYIPCVGSNICLRYGASYAFYDSDLNIISSENKSTTVFRNYPIPSGAKYARFDFVKADVEGKNNYIILGNYTEQNIPPYTPYQEHTLDLSWVKDIKDAEGEILFEDGLKSAGTTFDEAAKGRAIKRIGVKVFDGTENWIFANNIEGRLTNVCFLQMGDDFGALSKGDIVNMICSNYEQLVGYHSEESLLSYFNTIAYNIIRQLTIKDSAYTTSVETWKSHLADLYAQGNPLTVIYELAEPIEIEYDEKNLTYPVVAGGTEQAIASEDSTPIRASITYGSNTVATILSLINRVNELERKITN